MNKAAPESFPTTHCSKHPGELVNIFCGEHDIVCCSVCKALEHSVCLSTLHLPDAAKGVKTSEEYGNIKKYIKVLIFDIDKVLKEKKADVSSVTNQKQLVKQSIADFRKKINKYFDDLEKNSLDELDEKEKTIKGDIDKDKNRLEMTRQKAQEILKELESFKGDNECDLFVHVKEGNHFIEDAVQALSAISDTEEKPSIHFEIDKQFECLTSLKALGSFSSKSLFGGQLSTRLQQQDNIETQFIEKFDVKEKSDTITCKVFSICQLQDGTLLITDLKNKKLKRIDKSLKLQDSVKLSNQPHTVCAAGPGHVAVSVSRDKKIQFVSIGETMSLTKSFTVNDFCRGIVCIDNNLIICCGSPKLPVSSSGSIEVYNMAGQRQRTIAYTSGNLLSVPLFITASDDRQHLFVTSWKSEGLTMLDLTGNVVNSFSRIDMRGPNGVCADDGGHVFVCCLTSNTVVQLSPNHKKVEVILGETDGIKMPIAVFCDKERSKLIVSCDESNELAVYNLK